MVKRKKNIEEMVAPKEENSSQKLQAIRLAMEQIKKQYGHGSIMRLGEKVGDKFNQNTIKDAVIDNKEDNEYIPAFPNQMKRYSREEDMSIRMPMPRPNKQQFNKKIEKPMTMEMPEFNRQPLPMMSNERIRKSEPLFIKLDTFESALSSFNEIKLRIHEIESLLRNIKEVKMKEEKELNEWEREVQTIKARLEQIDKEIFDKLR